MFFRLLFALAVSLTVGVVAFAVATPEVDLDTGDLEAGNAAVGTCTNGSPVTLRYVKEPSVDGTHQFVVTHASVRTHLDCFDGEHEMQLAVYDDDDDIAAAEARELPDASDSDPDLFCGSDSTTGQPYCRWGWALDSPTPATDFGHVSVEIQSEEVE